MKKTSKEIRAISILFAAFIVFSLPFAFGMEKNIGRKKTAALSPVLKQSLEESNKEYVLDMPKKELLNKLFNKIPRNYSIAKEKIVFKNRFLLYTSDGKHVMWGIFGRGYFYGKDNNGNYSWGIYTKSIFTGFYNGTLFWGRYRNGRWKSSGLFGLKRAYGKYIVFPHTNPTDKL